MSSTRPAALLVTIGVVAVGCGPKRVEQATRPTAPSLIVLLPDPDVGTTGRARVSNDLGSVDLSAPFASTRVKAGAAPGAVTTMTEAEVRRLFGAVLAALPAAPRHFTLRFKFESDALTDESTALVPEILRTVKAYAVPEVVVVGHTDTLGDAKANVALGLRRAKTVRELLVKAGLAPSTIEVTSHGEVDPLIKTPDNTAEARNRRVEITVR